jgi:MFS family permease
MNRQLLLLFTCNLSILFVGMGIFPLLPIYAGRFGATPSVVGIYLALTYIAITIGSLLTGWLTRHVSRRTVFVAAGMAGAPALFLLGQAVTLWHVMLLTGIVWFTGGIGLAIISVLTSLQAGEGERGKWFSWISLSMPLGAIAGGLAVSRLVAWQGYPLMFAAVAVVYAVWPLIGLLKLKDRSISKVEKVRQGSSATAPLGSAFSLLLSSALLSAVTISVIRLGLPLSMKVNQFSAASIAGTNVFGGLITIPVVLWFGALSDRIGRRIFLAFGYLMAALGGLILIGANQLWHFWIVTAMMLIARTVIGSLSSTLATDILPAAVMDRALPTLNTTAWVAGVIGYAGSGYLMDALGATGLFGLAVLFSLGAVGLLGFLPGTCPGSAPVRYWWRLRQPRSATDGMC